MKKLLMLSIGELSKLAIECRCGTETVLNLAKPIDVPWACPGCAALWDEHSLRKPLQGVKEAFSKLILAQENEKLPKLIFRVTRDCA